jgi:two-component system response regulator YesN
MYRVLIVDDEPYVVDWISGLLETQQDMELDICRSYSATEALDWLNRAKIDILISDIRMPDMSGISLMEKVRQSWPFCRVILLTAYAEFEYAYQAIKNDVVSYILKTEDDDRILDEIKKAVDLLNSELNNRQLLDEAHEHLSSTMSSMHKEAVMSIMKGEDAEDGDVMCHLQALGLDAVPDAELILFVGRIERPLSRKEKFLEQYKQISDVKSISNH